MTGPGKIPEANTGSPARDPIYGAGEMADLIRHKDWSQTALGPMEQWSETLIATVNVLLLSPFSFALYWGEELTLLYNDAYREHLGEKHPAALGADGVTVWREAWDSIGPPIQEAFTAGTITTATEVLIPILLEAKLQDRWWTYGFYPVFENGRIRGVANPGSDDTPRIIAKNALQASEAQANRVLQSIADAVIVMDSETRVQQMNPVAEALTGWTLDQARGRLLQDVFHIVHENTRQIVKSPARNVKDTGSAAGLASPILLLTRGGSEVAIEDSTAPIRDTRGELTGMVLVFRDISERRKSEKARRENERHLQTFADFLPALAWAANPDGYITWYNRGWYDYTGTTPSQVEGWGWQSVHDPAILPAVLEEWTRCIRLQEPFEMVFPLRGTDGILRSFLTRVVPIRDDAGKVIQWFGTHIEIDELQRTRIRLEESEAGLNQVMSATRDAVVSVNRDWILTYLNPTAEKLYGTRESLVGRNLWEAFPDAVYEGSPFVEHYNRAMTEGISGRFEAPYGEPLNITIGLEVYPSKQGIVTFSRDITELKQATAAALQNEKLAAVGRLASSIAHEINNPLESVTNLLYLARRTENSVHLDDYLETAERELRRVAVITNQTLRFHKQSTQRASVSASSLLRESLSIYHGRLINSQVEVEERMRAERPIVCLEGEIRQVLSNLIGNAIDAMNSSGGRLLLRSRQAINRKTGQRGLALTVADTGFGMSPQTRLKVFDAFFSTKGIGGTGLGLWVSKEIVDRHQGTLSLRSSQREHAHGTVFVLFLPFELVTPMP